jgi:hypothetical protein
LAAENAATSDAGATFAFFSLVADTASVALDQLGGLPSAADVATYQTDLALAGQYITGCR